MYVTGARVGVEVSGLTSQVAGTDLEAFVQRPQSQPLRADRLGRNDPVKRVVIGVETPSCSRDVTH